ncbi:hypothetical protein LZC95_19475 [Pendulispora brunnea]|uniref:Uncharacterized protein n=1 Tax=Pendulispora brunnea TaxID=2905690 RepID=A0ABZ2KK05_9BACT
MTQNKQLKTEVRARMARTGESYTAARTHILAPAADEGKGRHGAHAPRADATEPDRHQNETMNRYEQAVIRLTIRASDRVVAVDDGVDKWLCRTSEFEQVERDMRKQPAIEVDDPDDFDDACVDAYNDFCGRFKTVATVVGSNRGEWYPLVLAAIDADLIAQEHAGAYGTPPPSAGASDGSGTERAHKQGHARSDRAGKLPVSSRPHVVGREGQDKKGRETKSESADDRPWSKIPWREIVLYHLDGSELTYRADRRRFIAALNEFRRSESIANYFLVEHDPSNLDDWASSQGLEVDDVDWAGFRQESETTWGLGQDVASPARQRSLRLLERLEEDFRVYAKVLGVNEKTYLAVYDGGPVACAHEEDAVRRALGRVAKGDWEALRRLLPVCNDRIVAGFAARRGLTLHNDKLERILSDEELDRVFYIDP